MDLSQILILSSNGEFLFHCGNSNYKVYLLLIYIVSFSWKSNLNVYSQLFSPILVQFDLILTFSKFNDLIVTFLLYSSFIIFSSNV